MKIMISFQTTEGYTITAVRTSPMVYTGFGVMVYYRSEVSYKTTETFIPYQNLQYMNQWEEHE